MDARVTIGTSGYSYADWKGSFYPEDIRNPQMLPYYAEQFDTVELNFTYYAIPKPKTLERMVAVTPDRFEFWAKLHQTMTHQRDRTQVEAFQAAIEPARQAGKLAGLLAQFPYSFKNTEDNRRYLGWLAKDFEGYPLAAEFRHDSWIFRPTFDFLRQNGLAYCCVDEPALHGLIPPIAESTSDVGYVRFHSRNASKWCEGGGKERYNYLYSKDELAEWIPKVRKLKEEVDRVYIFFNNCHAGHAAVNATQFREMLAELGLLGPNERRSPAS